MERSPENKELRLDNRHLLLFFLGAVLVCASFFSLGFWLGRGQAGEALLAVGDGLQLDLPASGASAGAVNPPAATGGIRAKPPDQPAGPASAKPDPANPPDFRKDLDFYSAVKDQSVDENFRPRPLRGKESENGPAAVQGSKGPVPLPVRQRKPAPPASGSPPEPDRCQSPGRRAAGQGIPRGGRRAVEIGNPGVDSRQGRSIPQRPENIPGEGSVGP